MKTIKEFKNFIENWKPVNEDKDPFIDSLKEALTYITDEWTDWNVSFTNTNCRYIITFRGDVDFSGLKELISKLNAVNHHLDDSIDKFKFTIYFEDNRIELKLFVTFKKIVKPISLEDIFIDVDSDYFEFGISLSKLEDYLETKTGYRMELEERYEKRQLINCKLHKFLEEDSEEYNKFCNNFSKILSDVFDNHRVDTEFYFKDNYNIEISFHGYNQDCFEIAP